MPKRSASTRHGAQRNKPKVQKNFELVRPERVEIEAEEEEESSTTSDEVAVATQEESKPSAKASTAVRAKEEARPSAKVSTTTDGQEQALPLREEPETQTGEHQNTPAPRSASARMAARRQAVQKLQQRSAATLITSEHFAYVRKDLIKIAIFAVLMITAIIVLYFTLGRA